MENIDWHNKWILLVEDDYASSEYLHELLNRTKINILKATSGEEAIREFQKNQDKIDVVLMDIQLPDIDGIEATKRIKAINDSVIVIAQTAFAMAADKDKFLSEGCDDYITKPIIGYSLMEKLSAYM